ncbi:MAG: FHA domain-containing protein [Tepidiformaceae bacterium]
MLYGTLRLTTPDGQVREYPIETQSVVIGRSDGNGVVIDHVSVSRRHAQLRIADDGTVSVEDLSSANGTFVGSQRIGASQSHVVEEGQSLRFGDVEGRFVSAQAAAASNDVAASPLSAVQGETQATNAVALTSPASAVAAGAATTATVVVQNRASAVDQVSLSVLDVPESWVRISRPKLSMAGGSRDEVTIVIQPPRTSEATAGDHPFSVSVISAENGREVRVLGSFAVLPFDAFSMNMVRKGAGSYEVVTENQGNTPLSAKLEVPAGATAIESTLDRDAVDLQPGQREVTGLRVTGKAHSPFGQVEQRNFRVVARPSRPGMSDVSADGQIAVKPALRWWRVPLAALAALSIFSFVAFGYYRQCSSLGLPFCSSNSSASSPKSTPVPTAVAQNSATPGSASTAATGLHKGATAVVVNSPTGNCLRVRSDHQIDSTNANKLGELCNGDKVTITSDSVNAGNYIWWTVDNGKGLVGWAAEKSTTAGAEAFLVLSQ